MIIRPAEPAEYDAVGDLCSRAYWAGGGMVAGDSDRYDTVLRNVADRAAHAPVLVALRDGDLVGTATLTPPGTPFAEISRAGEMEFRFLAVDPRAWGTGVGEALTRGCIDIARAAAAGAMVICVLDGNERAAGLYRRQGFVREPERDFRPAPPVQLRAYRLALT
jgi:ribosomal protein S18 acetylase RimI-like enzyme